MPLKIISQDITEIECDAIVNLSVHEAAGSELLKSCEMGKAKITSGVNLLCKYVIHPATTGWYGDEKPEKSLASCYTECLKLAKAYNCESVAFSLIDSGAYSSLKEDILKTATRVISDFLLDNDMLVYLAVSDKNTFEIDSKIFSDIIAYIDSNHICECCKDTSVCNSEVQEEEKSDRFKHLTEITNKQKLDLNQTRFKISNSVPQSKTALMYMPPRETVLEDILRNLDKGFAETLFYYIDKKGYTDVECYKKSNVDKKTFSKLKCNANYRPSKLTAVSFAIGLRLTLEEAAHLLSTAGMCLSHANKFDLIIEYFLKTGNYNDIFEVNEVLFKFDQELLGE